MSFFKEQWANFYDYQIMLGEPEEEAVEYADKRVEELKELNYTPSENEGNE